MDSTTEGSILERAVFGWWSGAIFGTLHASTNAHSLLVQVNCTAESTQISIDPSWTRYKSSYVFCLLRTPKAAPTSCQGAEVRALV